MVAWLREQISWNPVRPDYRRDVAITTLSLHGPDVPVAEWQLVFRNAFPSTWEHSDLQAMEDNVLFQTITLQYECLDVERSIFDGLPGEIMDLIT
jgi:phage tail-like protein